MSPEVKIAHQPNHREPTFTGRVYPIPCDQKLLEGDVC